MAESILAQVKAEAAKAKRESVKAKLKTLYADYNKAVAVVEGIEQEIVKVISEVGEKPEDVKALLADE